MLPRLPLPRMGNAPTLREQGGDALALAGIAHDARNLVTALGLCAEMIGEPGVLAPHHSHFATEIRSITAASAHLVERISGLARTAAQAKQTPFAETPVTDLSEAVRQMGSLLSAVAGPVTELQIACLPARRRDSRRAVRAVSVGRCAAPIGHDAAHGAAHGRGRRARHSDGIPGARLRNRVYDPAGRAVVAGIAAPWAGIEHCAATG
jgi:signal transduction histidine kinase